MPIKARRIDPDRARLAARGQWLQREQPVTHDRVTVRGNTRGSMRSNRSSSSSTSSSGTSNSTKKTGQLGQNARGRETRKNSSGTTKVFITATQAVESSTEASNSDPELYRAARERTARFLYPNDNANIRNKTSAVRIKDKESTMTEKVPHFVSPAMREMEKMTPNKKKTGIERHASNNDRHREGEVNRQRSKSSGSSCSGLCLDDDSGISTSRLASSITLKVVPGGGEKSNGTLLNEDHFHLQETSTDKVRNGEVRLDVDMRDSSLDANVATLSVEQLHIQEINEKEQDREHPGSRIRSYVRPPRTFKDLQERALLQLYTEREEGEEEEVGRGGEDKRCTYFIATDHMAEAFTLASLEAAREGSSLRCHTDPEEPNVSYDMTGQPYGAPLSLLEIVGAECARRNALSALHRRKEEGDDVLSINHNTDLLICADASTLAANAEESLRRFLSAVRCIESAVRDPQVIEDLGCFLFKHHKHFLHVGGEGAKVGSPIREYPHEAFTTYEQYSHRLDRFLIGLLNHHVPHFNAEEFVLTLYDVHYDSSKDETIEERFTTLDVLSYPAWRLLQSTSSFDEFCSFMDDFIAEEYGVAVTEHHPQYMENSDDMVTGDGDDAGNLHTLKALSGNLDNVVVAAGARGIQALLSKATTSSAWHGNRERTGLLVDGDAPVFPSRGSLSDLSLRHIQQQPKNKALEVGSQLNDPAGSVPVRFGGSSASLFTPSSLLAVPHQTTSPLPGALSSSQRSSRNSVSSFPMMQPVGKRRPEAVVGHYLPPISPRDTGDKGEALHSTLQPGSAPPKEGTLPLTKDANSALNGRFKSLQNADCRKGVKSVNRPRPLLSISDAGDKRCNGSTARNCGGPQNGTRARSTAKSTGVHGKETNPR